MPYCNSKPASYKADSRIEYPEATQFEVAQAKRFVITAGETATTSLKKLPIPYGQHAYEADAAQPIREAMAAEGWMYAGGGHFSLVFIKGALAMKIGLKSVDSGYIYAAWCRANSRLAGVLNVHAIEKGSYCYVVLMDRCYDLDRNDRLTRDEMDECIHYISSARDFPPSYDTGYTAAKIREFFIGIATFDLHRGNMMADRFGHLVITDPVAHSRSDTGASAYSRYYTETGGYTENYTHSQAA